MRLPGSDLLRSWRGVGAFAALPAGERRVVFYAEDRGAWPHLGPIVEALAGRLPGPLCYLTSQYTDPVLHAPPEGVRPIFVGSGTACTYLFVNLRADILVLTMPDLETLHRKRSRVHDVHYVYVFHSIVSTHMIYRSDAFDHYDTLLAVGPHHVAEVRAAEALRGLAPKTLVEHGYGRLDRILAARREPEPLAPGAAPEVLVAPSWGEHGLFETLGAELVETLLGAGFRVTARPHPETARRTPGAIAALRRCAGREGFALETDVSSEASLHRSHVLISDWSGAALEYAFGLERPVIFVDVPRKVRNPGYERLGIEPLEVSARSEIGTVLAPEALRALPGAIREALRDPARRAGEIRAARERAVFNVGRSARVAADYLAELAERRAAR